MKINDYSQMINHITKNNNTPEQNRIADLKQNLPNQKRMLKKRNDLGINTTSLQTSINKAEQEIEDFKAPIKQDDPMTTWVKNNNANNANPGTFKKLVKEDEAQAKKLYDPEKILEKYEDDYVTKRGEQTIALTNTANKLKGNANKDDYILKEDGNGLMVNKNRTIAVRDSFVAKQFNRALGVEPEASPEAFGKLAERLERNRQMEGKAPSKPQDLRNSFIKHRQKLGNVIRNQKDKKVVLLNKPEPFKFNINPVLPRRYFEPAKLDPRTEALGRKVFAEAEKNQQEKIRNANSGVAGLMGGVNFDKEKI
jgi:hypothetical protein